MKEGLLKGLTEEQIAKIKACKNQEELLSLAKVEGIELTDDQLEAVSGGACTTTVVLCPKCGKTNFTCIRSSGENRTYCRCIMCGNEWIIDRFISDRSIKTYDPNDRR